MTINPGPDERATSEHAADVQQLNRSDESHDRPSGAMLRRITVAASAGSVIEFFDLAVYGALAAIMSKVFFPGTDTAASLLNTFAVFALAFAARPIGGLIWGPIGDRIGRKATLAAIIILMALATAAIGVLPGRDSIGILAPLGLVLLRFAQGISVGGELPGATIFVGEHAPPKRRAFLSSFLVWGANLGQLAGLLLAALLFATLSTGQMTSWGWRIPFLLGLPLGAIGIYIRSKVDESPEFRKAEQLVTRIEHPLKAILGTRRGWKMLGRALVFNSPAAFTGYMLTTFMPSYLTTQSHLSSAQGLLLVTVSVLVLMAAQPIAGLLSDRFGRRRILLWIGLLELAVPYPAFALLQSGHGAAAITLPMLGLVLIAVVHGAATGQQGAPTLESFPTRFRYTGYAVALGLIVALFSGPTPYLATWLISVTGNAYAPAWLVIASAVPAVIGFFFVKETAGRPLPT